MALTAADRAATGPLSALGSALLAVGVAISALRARSGRGGDLDPTVFGAGVVAALALLGLGLLARVVVREPGRVRALASWPLALGSLAAGLVVEVGLGDDVLSGAATTYVAGTVAVTVAVASCVLVPSAPPAVAVAVGAAVVWFQGFDDVFPDTTRNTSLTLFAVAVLVFVVLATALAWPVAHARTAVALVVGAGAVAAYAGAMLLVATRTIFSPNTFADGEVQPIRYDDDVHVTLLLTALLVLGWSLLGAVTGHAGFRVLAVLAVLTLVPVAVLALAVDRPTLWALGAGVLGVLILGAAARAAGVGRRSVATD